MEPPVQEPAEEEKEYRWPALESDPEIFTSYMSKLGMSDDWNICEIFGMDDDCLSFVPRPCVGVIVTFERTENRDDGKQGDGTSSTLVPFYMKQTKTLDNACGIIACLHAIMNHTSDISLTADSILDKFQKETADKTAEERATYLEEFKEFQEEHKSHASQGQTEAPTSSKKVLHHFVAFIMNSANQLVELDGTKDGPAVIQDDCEDLLKGVATELQRRLADGNITESLSMMALSKKA
ncbi:unnamed protein product [Moneuplotes crassus]|uniref:Ubiquitin carboxyl-terminal hydrolase n=2 Tax=Euplotes crassus TaxID=5936 RepID=A0AAD2D4I9_EUPCR|nr:unnamed protein product [Moneuplotes crassus]